MHDPEWTRPDRMAALAWSVEDRQRCDCGQPLYETIPVGGPEFDAVPVTCRACKAIADAASIKAGQDDLDPNAGTRWRTERAKKMPWEIP